MLTKAAKIVEQTIDDFEKALISQCDPDEETLQALAAKKEESRIKINQTVQLLADGEKQPH